MGWPRLGSYHVRYIGGSDWLLTSHPPWPVTFPRYAKGPVQQPPYHPAGGDIPGSCGPDKPVSSSVKRFETQKRCDDAGRAALRHPPRCWLGMDGFDHSMVGFNAIGKPGYHTTALAHEPAGASDCPHRILEGGPHLVLHLCGT